MEAAYDNLESFRIVKSEMFTGVRKAIKSGNTIYVSPAMFELMSKEKGDALIYLLKNIPLVDIGEFDDSYRI